MAEALKRTALTLINIHRLYSLHVKLLFIRFDVAAVHIFDVLNKSTIIMRPLICFIEKCSSNTNIHGVSHAQMFLEPFVGLVRK